MRENVFEIISHLVKRLLYSDNSVNDEKKLIKDLRSEGYDLDEISQAFEFIFSNSKEIKFSESNSKIINKEFEGEKIELNNRVFNRVFNFREKLKLNVDVQGIIIKLIAFNLVKGEEIELVISKSLLEHNNSIDIIKFWRTLEMVIDDDFRLSLISRRFEELEGLVKSKDSYIN